VNALLSLRDAQDKPEPGVGTIGVVEDTTGDVDSSEDKWGAAAIIFTILAIIVVIILLLLLCRKIWALGKNEVSENDESTDEEDLVIMLNQSSWNSRTVPSDDNLGGAYAVPNADVHKCKSSSCPTCSANNRDRTAEFIPASPSWCLSAVFSPYLSRSTPRSFSRKSERVDY
jgi:hypothetical protein